MNENNLRDIDKGWAWVVLVAAYLGLFLYCNSLFMGGVFYLELVKNFNASEATASLCGALNAGILCLGSPIGGIVVNKYSCRVAIISGGILSTVGFVLAAFVDNLEIVIITAGVIVGFGYALSSPGLLCAVGFYFQKWRAEVISAAFLFVGCGVFSSAPFGLYIFSTHGLTGGFLILAGILAQLCVVGMLCKPSVLENRVHVQRKKVRIEGSSFTLRQYLDLSLLNNAGFLCFLLSTATWNFALVGAIVNLPNYMSVLGGNTTDISLLMTSLSVANIIGRLTGTITLNRFPNQSLYVHVVVMAISGVLTSIFPFYAKLTGGAYIFAVQIGLFCGWPNGMMAPLAVKFVGISKLSEAYGLAYCFSGFGLTPGPVIIAAIYSATKSYEYSFVVAGVVSLLGAVAGAASVCLRKPDHIEQEINLESKENLHILYKNTEKNGLVDTIVVKEDDTICRKELPT